MTYIQFYLQLLYNVEHVCALFEKVPPLRLMSGGADTQKLWCAVEPLLLSCM